MKELKKSTRKITEIILHCSASREGDNWSVEGVRKYHKSLGWVDIGYNYYIELDGSVKDGRNVNISGAHTVGHNANSIGICYCGGVDRNLKPKDTRTDAQKESLYALVNDLLILYPNATIHCHNEYANKACPSFKIDQFKNEFKQWLAQKHEHKCDYK